MSNKIVGYVRVSTARQGDSGLGLEAQMTAIGQYASSVSGEIVSVFREIESGRNNDRPQLAKAIATAKRMRAKLVIAKLDRLARNVHFITGLMESKVDFLACDNPCANKMTVQILACVAENEAEMISQRTKAALTAAKARGTLLGSARPNHWAGREDIRLASAAKARLASVAKAKETAAPIVAEVQPIAAKMRADGQSLAMVASQLNANGFATIRGGQWTPIQVSRLLADGGR